MKYEYGVEYETKGEKPDLPDDVLVHVMFDGKWQRPDVVDVWIWGESRKFRIVDERWKPEQEADFIADRMEILCPDGEYRDVVSMIEDRLNQSNTSQTNWHERGELPPVGTECEFSSEGHHSGWIWCIFRGLMSDGGLIIEYHHHTSPNRVTCCPFDPRATKFRALRTERDVLADSLSKEVLRYYNDYLGVDCDIHEKTFAGFLIDANWRPVKQQTEDEFITQARRELTDHVGTNQIVKLYRAGCRFVDQGE